MAGNKKILFLIIFLVAFFSVFIFTGRQSLAVSKFGESCSKASDCVSGLLCSGNTCVQCRTDKEAIDCNKSANKNESCLDGVCVAPEGNLDGALCVYANDCVSDNCADNICKPAQGGGSRTTTTTTKPAGGGENPLGNFPGENFSAQDVTGIVIGFACWLIRIAMLLPFIFLVLAGFRFMAAGDNPKKHDEAKANFKTVIWGILVIFSVYVIIATVANAVGITDFSFIPLVC